MKKGLIPITVLIGAAIAGAIAALIFLVIFKVRITNAIIYEHKSDMIGYSYNTILSLDSIGKPNSEFLGLLVFKNDKKEIEKFQDNFKDNIKKMNVLASQKCVSLILRKNSDLTIDESFANKGEIIGMEDKNGNDIRCLDPSLSLSLIQTVAPIALPYNQGDKVKLMSMVTNK